MRAWEAVVCVCRVGIFASIRAHYRQWTAIAGNELLLRYGLCFFLSFFFNDYCVFHCIKYKKKDGGKCFITHAKMYKFSFFVFFSVVKFFC